MNVGDRRAEVGGEKMNVEHRTSNIEFWIGW